MHFTDAATWLWALAVIGGPLILGLAYGYVLLLRRRNKREQISARALQPARDARARGRALHPGDMVSLAAGIWLFISPWVLTGLSSDTVREFHTGWLLVSNDVFGAMIAIFALAAIYRLHAAEELIIAGLGVWVFLSPWIIGGAATPPELIWSNWIVGAVVVLAAVSSLLRSSRTSRHVVHGSSRLASRG